MTKAILAGLLACLGVVFWQRPGNAPHRWPPAIPAFSSAPPTFSLEMKNGTSVVSIVSNDSPDALLSSALAAYRTAGWKEAPVGTRDTRLFVKGEAVAALTVRPLSDGSCLTVIQRPRGL